MNHIKPTSTNWNALLVQENNKRDIKSNLYKLMYLCNCDKSEAKQFYAMRARENRQGPFIGFTMSIY